jgi:hypothetical protein
LKAKIESEKLMARAILPDLLVLPKEAGKQIEENDLDSALRCREVVRTGFHPK